MKGWCTKRSARFRKRSYGFHIENLQACHIPNSVRCRAHMVGNEFGDRSRSKTRGEEPDGESPSPG